MTQLQISITVDANGKLRVEINKLQREDATENEIMIAKNMEIIFMEQFKAVARESGIGVKEKKILSRSRLPCPSPSGDSGGGAK